MMTRMARHSLGIYEPPDPCDWSRALFNFKIKTSDGSCPHTHHTEYFTLDLERIIFQSIVIIRDYREEEDRL